MLAPFISYERWRESHDRSPLIESSLLTHRTFVVGLMLTLVLFVGMTSFIPDDLNLKPTDDEIAVAAAGKQTYLPRLVSLRNLILR